MARSEDVNFKLFTLHIEGVSIDNVALEDIGQYLSDFADMLGKDASPRYHRITRGSLTIAAKVPAQSEMEVKTRGFLLRTGDAPEDAVRARQRISRRLGIHHARRATWLDQTQTKIMEIPIERPLAPVEIPALSRSGTVQGKVIRIGGKQDTVSVEIQDVDGHIYLCRAARKKAKELAREMFDTTVRAHGSGRWKRGDDGVWSVEDFLIADFETLDEDELSNVVAQLRSVPSASLGGEEVFDKLEKMRHGEAL